MHDGESYSNYGNGKIRNGDEEKPEGIDGIWIEWMLLIAWADGYGYSSVYWVLLRDWNYRRQQGRTECPPGSRPVNTGRRRVRTVTWVTGGYLSRRPSESITEARVWTHRSITLRLLDYPIIFFRGLFNKSITAVFASFHRVVAVIENLSQNHQTLHHDSGLAGYLSSGSWTPVDVSTTPVPIPECSPLIAGIAG